MTTVLAGVFSQVAEQISDLLPAIWEMNPSETTEKLKDEPAGAQRVGWTIANSQLLVSIDEESADFLTKEAANLHAALEEGITEIIPLLQNLVPDAQKLEFPSIGDEALEMFNDHEGVKQVITFFDQEEHRATIGLSAVKIPQMDEEYADAFPAGVNDDGSAEKAPVSTRITDDDTADSGGPAPSSQVTGQDGSAGGMPQDDGQAFAQQPFAQQQPMMQAPHGQANYGMPQPQPGINTPLVSSVNPNAMPHAGGRQHGGTRMPSDAIASPAEFSSFDEYGQMHGAPHPMALLGDVEMGVTAELGRTRLTIKDILGLTPGSIIELDRAAGAPVDVVVNGTLIARGEVVVIDEEFGIRISQIIGVHDVVQANQKSDAE